MKKLPPPPKRPDYTKEQVDAYLEFIRDPFRKHGHLVELHQGGTVTVKEGQSVAQAFVNATQEAK